MNSIYSYISDIVTCPEKTLKLVKKIKIILKKNPNEATKESNNETTSLMLACLIADDRIKTKIVKMLIRAGCNVNLQDNDGNTALSVATRYSDIKIVKLLINAGSNVNLHNREGWTALMIASRYSNIKIVKLLIDAGADVNMQNSNKWIALMMASRYSTVEKVKLLIESGSNINLQDITGWSALMLACRGSKTETVKLLLDAGSDVNLQNNEGLTALMCVILFGEKTNLELFSCMILNSQKSIMLKNMINHTAYDCYLNVKLDILDDSLLKMLKGDICAPCV